MRTRAKQCAVGLLALLGVNAHVLVAAAASPVRDELSAEAQKDWDAARELYDARDYRSALVHYQRSFDVSNNPRVLFNVGVCWKELTQYALAIRVWERALGLRAQMSTEEAQKFEYAIAAARPFVSTVRLETDQVGAVLSIDGNEVATSPFIEAVPIDVGHRKLALAKPGFETAERSVDVVQGRESAVSMKLLPLVKTGTVSVSVANGVAAALFVDGRELGPAPFNGELPEGPHTFEARAPGYVTTRQTSKVEYKQSLRVLLSLGNAHNEGKLRVLVNHSDARIHLDGGYKGTGAWEGLLPAGGHQLTVEKPDYVTFSQEVSLSAAQERALQVQLNKQPTWLWWTVGIASVVGGGAVAAVLLSRQAETAHVPGTFDTVSSN